MTFASDAADECTQSIDNRRAPRYPATVVDPDVFVAFVASCAVLLFMPGPTILLVVSYALTHGRRSAFATIAGVIAGDLVAVTLALMGLGTLLRASASLFFAMKMLGALYLVYLGVKMWRAPGLVDTSTQERPSTSNREMALDAFTVTVLNPKSGMFLVAFLPQFMDPSKPIWPQNVALGSVFMVLAFASVAVYALLASRVHAFVKDPTIARLVNRAGGTVLVGAGILTATMRRA